MTYRGSSSRVTNGTLIIEPNFDDLNSKTFVSKTVYSNIKLSKGLFKLGVKFPVNDNYFWSTIHLSRPDAKIEFISQTPEEKFSPEIKTGIALRSNKSFEKEEYHTPAHNMTHSFNEVSIEWNNKKILWKLNDQLINDVDLKEFSGGNESIAQIFNNTFILVMTLTLRQESYNDSNFSIKNIHKPYLYIDYIRVYKQKETKTTTNSFPNAKKTGIDLHSKLGANNANSFLNTNKTIPLLLVILVVFIL
jgi:hypothetical protein